MTNSQRQMDAVVIRASGPPAQSLSVQSEPVPEPGPGEVLVEVHAAGVNPFDAVNALGLFDTPLPTIPGLDFAGVVVSEGDLNGVEVWGSAQVFRDFPDFGTGRPGTHARYVALPETWLSRKPESLTMVEAGAVGRAYLAAWEAVIESGNLKAGETLVITGGAGMVGQAATAIARWRGATPIVAGRGNKPEDVKHFINTTSSDLRDEVLAITGGQGADMVLDLVGGALFEPALRSVRFRGRMAGLISHEPRVEFDLAEFLAKEVHLTGIPTAFMDPMHVADIFNQLGALFDAGLLTLPAIRTWPLANAAEAYQTVLDGSAGIKQVLLPLNDKA